MVGLPLTGLEAYILRRYCPPTSNSALVICPSEQQRTASISTSNTLALAITACCSLAVIANTNVFEVLMDAVRCCSLGQITNALFEVGGQYRRSM